MSYLFSHTIANWADWSRVYCDIDAFTPLIRAVFAREGLPVDTPIEGLTPGTNAVFRCGDKVIKLYAPAESGLSTQRDYAVEIAMLNHARRAGVRTSNLHSHGIFQDRYCFYYLVFEYIIGEEAGGAIVRMSAAKKRDFAQSMGSICERLHQPCDPILPPLDIRAHALDNSRTLSLPPSLRDSVLARAKGAVWDQSVLVHGDLTGENVLIAPDRKPVLIDFADSVWGPWWYELPPLVFELFRCDKEMIGAFRGSMPLPLFMERLLDGLSLHDFCASILQEYAEREQISLRSLTTLQAVAARLYQAWKD